MLSSWESLGAVPWALQLQICMNHSQTEAEGLLLTGASVNLNHVHCFGLLIERSPCGLCHTVALSLLSAVVAFYCFCVKSSPTILSILMINPIKVWHRCNMEENRKWIYFRTAAGCGWPCYLIICYISKHITEDLGILTLQFLLYRLSCPHP